MTRNYEWKVVFMTQADMNESDISRLREILWRRPLNPTERTALQRWLREHPGGRADWEAELALAGCLDQLSPAPVSSNFTARVLEAVDRESTGPAPGSPVRPVWLNLPFLARAGAALLLMTALGLFLGHRQRMEGRAELARCVAVAVEAARVPGVEALTDFETIQRLGHATPVDEELFLTLTELASN